MTLVACSAGWYGELDSTDVIFIMLELLVAIALPSMHVFEPL